MQNSNTKKVFNNITVSILSEVITIALGIVIPRMFLVSFGSEMNGLLTSVAQIYTYMALLEAGVGSVTLQSLYKPVAENDYQSLNSILSATHLYYKKIGAVYLAGIFLLAVGYPLVVDTSIPFWTVSIIVFLNGITGALSFFLTAKFDLLLRAEGKAYIITNASLIVHIAISVSKIVLIAVGVNILVIQTSYALFNLLKIAYLVLYIKKHYKWIDLSVKPKLSAIAQRGSAFVLQISDLIFRNTDILILTLTPNCGLMVVSVYTMYQMLYGMIQTAINTLWNSVYFVLGQTFNTDREKYIKYHDMYEVFNMTITFSLYTIAYLFITPFLRLYTDGINDISYIDKWLPLLFVMISFLSVGRGASSQVINFAKHFKKTQWRAILEAVINIAVSIPCCYFFGIYGVLFGTIAALLYRTNDMIIYANRKILNRSCLSTYKRWITNFIVFVAISWASKFITLDLSNYFTIILWAIVACLVIIPIYFIVAAVTNYKVYLNVKSIVLDVISRKFAKKQKETPAS